MASNTDEAHTVSVSAKGQATIPKEIREALGIEAPGQVVIYERDGRAVVEPLPATEELRGSHEGAAVERLREHREREREREEQDERDAAPER